MAAIRREHARNAERVRIEIREAGTLVGQYEDEKEQRARHMLRTFSKVRRKQQAAQDWKTAYQRRMSVAASSSPTFDVEIGDAHAPWGGGRRRDSNLSMSSSTRRKSSTGSLSNAFTKATARLSRDSVSRGRVALAQHGGSTLSSASLHLTGLAARRRTSSSSTSDFPAAFVKTWKTAMTRRKQQAENPGEFRISDVDEPANMSGMEKLADEGPSLSTDTTLARGARKRQVFWTETFPYVYHSAGETVCPRYKLFLQYDEYKVHPQLHKGQRKNPSISAPSVAGSSQLSLKSLTQSVLALSMLAKTRLPSLSLDSSFE